MLKKKPAFCTLSYIMNVGVHLLQESHKMLVKQRAERWFNSCVGMFDIYVLDVCHKVFQLGRGFLMREGLSMRRAVSDKCFGEHVMFA